MFEELFFIYSAKEGVPFVYSEILHLSSAIVCTSNQASDILVIYKHILSFLSRTSHEHPAGYITNRYTEETNTKVNFPYLQFVGEM